MPKVQKQLWIRRYLPGMLSVGESESPKSWPLTVHLNVGAGSPVAAQTKKGLQTRKNKGIEQCAPATVNSAASLYSTVTDTGWRVMTGLAPLNETGGNAQ